MNMNRAAVDAALGLAGNMPLTDDDKKYRNLPYVFCLNLYLPSLFNSLCEIDWRCARKFTPLHQTGRYTIREPGKFYYEIPGDCIRPLYVDDNDTDFRNDSDFIITDRPVSRLYYVFHKRKVRRDIAVSVETVEYDALPSIIASPLVSDGNDPHSYIRMSPQDESPPPSEPDEDFPDWEYTPYDADFWQYFSYRLAARLVPKLRADDGAAQRAQALEAVAAQIGEHAIERSRSSSVNASQPNKLWIESAGIPSVLNRHGMARDYASGQMPPCRSPF
jgi:hypothetical protein